MQLIQLKNKIKQLFKSEHYCKICFKKINQISLHNIFSNNIICKKCLKSMDPKFYSFKVEGVKTIAVFEYNQKIKELLYQFKGCMDYELKDAFLTYYVDYLKLLFAGYYIICAPSFKEHDQRRGFNHVKEIFSSLNLEYINCLIKTKDIKQADLSLDKRGDIYKYIEIDESVNLNGKKILLVDDVYTSGSTIKACLKLIKSKNPHKIRILLMSRRTIYDKY